MEPDLPGWVWVSLLAALAMAAVTLFAFREPRLALATTVVLAWFSPYFIIDRTTLRLPLHLRVRTRLAATYLSWVIVATLPLLTYLVVPPILSANLWPEIVVDTTMSDSTITYERRLALVQPPEPWDSITDGTVVVGSVAATLYVQAYILLKYTVPSLRRWLDVSAILPPSISRRLTTPANKAGNNLVLLLSIAWVSWSVLVMASMIVGLIEGARGFLALGGFVEISGFWLTVTEPFDAVSPNLLLSLGLASLSTVMVPLTAMVLSHSFVSVRGLLGPAENGTLTLMDMASELVASATPSLRSNGVALQELVRRQPRLADGCRFRMIEGDADIRITQAGLVVSQIRIDLPRRLFEECTPAETQALVSHAVRHSSARSVRPSTRFIALSTPWGAGFVGLAFDSVEEELRADLDCARMLGDTSALRRCLMRRRAYRCQVGDSLAVGPWGHIDALAFLQTMASWTTVPATAPNAESRLQALAEASR